MTKMETLPVETALEWITAWTNLVWPVSWQTAFAIRDQLGWIPAPDDGRLFTTILTPPGSDDGGYMTENDGQFSGLEMPLASQVRMGEKDENTAPVTWAAYNAYHAALTELYGKPRNKTDDDYKEATWYLPNGSSLNLGALPGLIDAAVHSPEDAAVDIYDQRLIAEYGENYEEFTGERI